VRPLDGRQSAAPIDFEDRAAFGRQTAGSDARLHPLTPRAPASVNPGALPDGIATRATLTGAGFSP
jgi:hypothetical protein